MSPEKKEPTASTAVPGSIKGGAWDTFNPERSRLTESEQPGGLSGGPPPASSERHRRHEEISHDSVEILPSPSPYLLRRRLGTGGFGEVWEAIQESLGRVIAVKRIRQDLWEQAADNEWRDRHLEVLFRQEALTTANLDHPNILPIHELELDEMGRPLLAMKLVRGERWKSLIAQDFLSVETADFLAKHLPILIHVAQAVAYAHSKGIVHRDIKPSQVMVGEFGEVYLMDWGLAVVHDKKLVAHTIPNAPLAALPALESAMSPAGTPAFMAPEQTQETAAGIGPWTDVYLLGGTLYYLLTGFPPHWGSTEEKIFQRAVNGEVPAPAARNPARMIPQELATLAMTAMEQDYRKRHITARDFISTLQDSISGSSHRRMSVALTQRVEARLPGIEGRYDEYNELNSLLSDARAQWAANPQLAALQSQVSGDYARAALRNEDLLLARLQSERLPSGPGRESLLEEIRLREAEKLRAVERLETAHRHLRKQHQRAEELLNFLVHDLAGKLQPIGRLDLLDAVGERVLAFFDSIEPEEMEPATRLHRAEALCLLGDVRQTKGELEGALESFREALALGLELARATPDDAAIGGTLAKCRARIGAVHRSRGEMDEALREFHQQKALLESLVERDPAVRERRFQLAQNCYSIADVLAVQGDTVGALESNAEYRRRMEELTREEPANTDWLRALAGSYADHGWLLKAGGDLDGATARYREALQLGETLSSREPANATFQADVAFYQTKVGWVLEAGGDHAGAAKAFLAAGNIMAELVEKDPANAEWRRLLSVAHTRAGFALEETGDLTGALENFRAAAAHLRPLIERSPKNVWNLNWMGRAYLGIGRVHQRTGSSTQAESAWNAAADVTKPIAREPEKADLSHLATHAQALLLLGRREAARLLV
ncbi:protein kinase, partial [Candidatus Poribacteria bacterium]|nr:protein kinase [Candidatus Poribacteria bacterium]